MTEKRRYLTDREKLIVVQRQNGLCACKCGEKLAPGRIRYDHVLPIHLSGTNDLDNFQALTVGHHQRKTDKETAARAKVKRIRGQGGLMKKKPSQREKAMARILEP